jgi:hypothetical protein
MMSVIIILLCSLITDVETINALMWSDKLDEIFAENLKRDPTIYQYFASKEGVLRYFPAHRCDISHVFVSLIIEFIL